MDNRSRLLLIFGLALIALMFIIENLPFKQSNERKESALQRDLQASIDNLSELFDIADPDNAVNNVKVIGEAWRNRRQVIAPERLAVALPSTVPASIGKWSLLEKRVYGGNELVGVSVAEVHFQRVSLANADGSEPLFVNGDERITIMIIDAPTLDMLTAFLPQFSQAIDFTESSNMVAGYPSLESNKEEHVENGPQLVTENSDGELMSTDNKSEEAVGYAEIAVKVRPHLFVLAVSNAAIIEELRVAVNEVDFKYIENIMSASDLASQAQPVDDTKAPLSANESVKNENNSQ